MVGAAEGLITVGTAEGLITVGAADGTDYGKLSILSHGPIRG